MLLYRELFLTTLISAVNVVFADILIQPAPQDNVELHNRQHVSRPEYISVPCLYVVPNTEKLYAQSSDQLVGTYVQSEYSSDPAPLCLIPITEKLYVISDQGSHVGAAQPQQLTETQTVHPHTVHSVYYPSLDSINMKGIGSYSEIGGHRYTRQPIVVTPHGKIYKYIKPAHRRNRRSTETTTESSKPALTTHADDVAAKSALIGDKLPAFIDFLLPKNQLTDTNDKHVTSRQIKSDHAPTRISLFGLYPEKMYEYRQAESPDEIQQPLFQSLPASPNTSEQSDEQLPTRIIKSIVTEQAQSTLSTIPQEKQLDQALYEDQQNTYQEFDNKLLRKRTCVVGLKPYTN